MKNIITPTIAFVFTITLTGIICYLAGMSRHHFIMSIIVAGVVSGSFAYGAAFANSRNGAKPSNKA